MFSWEKKNSMDRQCSVADRQWHERGENKCNGKKKRLLVAGCLRVVRPTAYEQQQQQQYIKGKTNSEQALVLAVIWVPNSGYQAKVKYDPQSSQQLIRILTTRDPTHLTAWLIWQTNMRFVQFKSLTLTKLDLKNIVEHISHVFINNCWQNSVLAHEQPTNQVVLCLHHTSFPLRHSP